MKTESHKVLNAHKLECATEEFNNDENGTAE